MNATVSAEQRARIIEERERGRASYRSDDIELDAAAAAAPAGIRPKANEDLRDRRDERTDRSESSVCD